MNPLFHNRKGGTPAAPGKGGLALRRNPAARSGFALVLVLSLMILLSLLAVGLLSLSSVSLRASATGNARSVARANARVALMLAIGQLQAALGPDQRVSANAGAVQNDPPEPNMLGAWEGFGWLPPAGAVPAASDKADKFLGWLTSTADPRDRNEFALPGRGGDDSVWLHNPATTGTLPDNDPSLRAQRVQVTLDNARGGMAWAVSDNSTRASIGVARPARDSLAENVARRSAAPGPQIEVLHDSFKKITDPSRIITLSTAEIPMDPGNRRQVSARAESLACESLGLLTDAVNGGLRTDLTPLMEGTTNLFTALGAYSPYFPAANTSPNTGDGAPLWDYLRSHYKHYRRLVGTNAGKPRFRATPISDYTPGRTGLVPKPTRETLLPVIAKVQIIFSLVSHHSHIGDRVSAFNNFAVPQGNANHAVPHLVYDPVVTLYNPYDVELELPQLRVRIFDPPVGFQLQKHDIGSGTNPWYRQEFAAGEFHGLGRFQIAKERDQNARKTFTLFLRSANAAGTPGGAVVLLPGEVKVFSPWVEKNWTWGLETQGGYDVRAFFDWRVENKLGDEDFRTKNKMGVETIPGLDFRAGLQADHMSYASGRPPDSLYSWERSPLGAGWLSMKLTDDVTIKARPQRCVRDPSLPDFRVDILAGSRTSPDEDILRTYEFRLDDVAAEMSPPGSSAHIISRRFNNSQILQSPSDPTPGGKSPFAIFTMTAKTTRDPRDDGKAWAHNNFAVDGASHDSRAVGNAAQSYDLRLDEIQDFTSFPGVEYDDATKRGFYGAIANASMGVSVTPMFRVPLTPAASLGDWIAANLVSTSRLPRVRQSLGSSLAHPLLSSSDIQGPQPGGTGRALDHTYLMNAALWDSYFFSSAAAYPSPAFSPARNRQEVLEDFFTGARPMLNQRLTPYLPEGASASALTERFNGLDDVKSAKSFAAHALIQGAFNINSDSVDAWRAVLSALRETEVAGYGNTREAPNRKTAFVRLGLPVAGSADDANPTNTVNALGQIRWAGYRCLSDSQIEDLARAIVTEIRARGRQDRAPCLSIAEFVNRRPGPAGSLHALRGILQTAIDKSGVNDNFHDLDSNTIVGAALQADRIRGLDTPAALDGLTADQAPSILSQGDLLTSLAPFITARGDTFTIRAYGEARSADNRRIEARAWCEATVQRVPEFVDAADEPDARMDSLTPANRRFGRRFILTSFRWLDPAEI